MSPSGNSARWRRFRSLTVVISLLVLVIGTAALPPAWAETTAETEESGALYLVTWEAAFLGQTQPGIACWVTSPEGAVRLEVLPAGAIPPTYDQLLNQEGEGFTLILGTGATGTFNPWQREWRKVDANAAGWVRLVAGVLTGGDPQDLAQAQSGRLLRRVAGSGPPRPRFLTTPDDDSRGGPIRVQLPALTEVAADPAAGSAMAAKPAASAFRRDQIFRGRGRGGDQEILTMQPENRDGQDLWSVSSSRKPGRVVITGPAVWPVGPVGPETFAPLWSLAQVLNLDQKISGTPPIR